MNIPGENLNGVYSANEFLTRINLMKAYYTPQDTPVKVGKSKAVVVEEQPWMQPEAQKGLVLKKSILSRRSEAEMPARIEEVHHAREEEIIFNSHKSRTNRMMEWMGKA